AALACVAVVMVGSAVQATIGIGMGMLAAPVLAMADPGFVPGAIVIAVIPLGVSVAVQGRHSIDRRGVVLALIGRLPGVVLGTVAVALLASEVLAVLVSLSVLLAVAATATRFRIRTTGPTLVTAGVASGFTGTATGIGGPPMALTYQHADPTTLRSTLGAFFTIGALMSLTGLVLSGSVGRRQWELALLILPGVVLGVLAARRWADRLRGERVRVAILALCGVSAVALLVETLV
nr:sulfite exporter TauE/SafE family protein [Ilumatobacteraceae bacterium]